MVKYITLFRTKRKIINNLKIEIYIRVSQYLEQKISILELFLKAHVTLKSN